MDYKYLVWENFMEIDLHHKKVNEAINYFMKEYNGNFISKRAIRVIHGYGSSGSGGVIKKRFKELSEAYKGYFRVEYDNNLGVTIVIPIKPIPMGNFLLEEEILEFCNDSPKSFSKIQGKFIKKFSNDELKKSLKLLLRKGQILEIQKKELCYLTKEE